MAVINGKFPEKPDKSTMIYEDLWDLCVRCFVRDQDLRPVILDVAEAVSASVSCFSLILTRLGHSSILCSLSGRVEN